MIIGPPPKFHGTWDILPLPRQQDTDPVDNRLGRHTFTCVLALQIAHLMRRHAAQAGP